MAGNFVQNTRATYRMPLGEMSSRGYSVGTTAVTAYPGGTASQTFKVITYFAPASNTDAIYITESGSVPLPAGICLNPGDSYTLYCGRSLYWARAVSGTQELSVVAFN